MIDNQQIADRLIKGIETLIQNAKSDVRFYEGAMEGIREFLKAAEEERKKEKEAEDGEQSKSSLSKN